MVECAVGALPRRPPHALVADAARPLRTRAMPTKHATELEWRQTRRFVVAMALLAAVPLLWPDIPPLVDLPGHMGRYRVQLDLHRYPWLTDWYDFKWSLIGNLGIDILVQIFAPLLGLELTVKLIVMTIPPLIVSGLLWIAREVHGRIPATALVALPLAYCFPLQFGFANFMLSMALALPLFAFWLRLGRLGKFGLRAALFVPLSCALWVCHTFGWGVLGVLAFSAEMVREHDRAKQTSEHRFNPVTGAGRNGQHVAGQTTDWFNWQAKFAWLTMILRDRWLAFDIASSAVIGLILYKTFRDPNIEYSRNLGLSTLFLVAVFVLLPRIVFGSAYADMRLAPFMIAIALISVRPRPLPGDTRQLALKHPGLGEDQLQTQLVANRRRTMQVFAMLGLAFVVVRTAGTTISYFLFDQIYDRQLKALDHIPQGARLVSFVGQNCVADWKMTRLEHMPALALERKEAYTNAQWSQAGAQLLTTKSVPARPFAHDPSQITPLTQCPREYWRPIDRSLARFPRAAFDYVWLINPPPYDPKYTEDLTPIWRDGTSAVFKVNHVDVAPVTKNGDFPLPPRGKTPLY